MWDEDRDKEDWLVGWELWGTDSWLRCAADHKYTIIIIIIIYEHTIIVKIRMTIISQTFDKGNRNESKSLTHTHTPAHAIL